MPFEGNPIIEGLLARKRFDLQDEELKLSRLQRLEFEATAAHRQTMNALAEQLAQSQLTRDRLGGQLDEINLQAGQFALEQSKTNAPIATATTQENLRGARAQRKGSEFALSSAKADRGYVQARQSQDLAKGQADLATSQMGLLNQHALLAGTVGSTIGHTPSVADAMSMVSTLGVKDESARSVMASMLMGTAEQKQMELEQNNQILSRYKAGAADAQARMVQFVASQGSAYADAYGQLVGTNDPIYLAARRTIDAGGLPTTARNVDPLDAEVLKGLVKEGVDLGKQVRTQEALVSDAQAAAQSAGWWTRDRKQNVAKVQQEKLDLLRAQQGDVSQAIDQLRGGGEAPRRNTPAAADSLAAFESKLMDVTQGYTVNANHTDELLRKLADRTGLDYEMLRKLRDSKKSKGK